MNFPSAGWANKRGTSDKTCVCGTWMQHWLNETGKPWPAECSVDGCKNKPTLGAHIMHTAVAGERIVPMCDSCNGLIRSFTLKGGVTLPSANKAITCEKKK